VADIHILRAHSLGLDEIRVIAFTWAELAEKEFGMSCIYEEGDVESVVFFSKPGIDGNLSVTIDKIEIQAKLGAFLSVFKARIESEILEKLDLLLGRSL
jgi:putative polyhydroxyalkanoate system protein